MRILVVYDNEAAELHAIREALTARGHDVVPCAFADVVEEDARRQRSQLTRSTRSADIRFPGTFSSSRTR